MVLWQLKRHGGNGLPGGPHLWAALIVEGATAREARLGIRPLRVRAWRMPRAVALGVVRPQKGEFFTKSTPCGIVNNCPANVPGRLRVWSSVGPGSDSYMFNTEANSTPRQIQHRGKFNTVQIQHRGKFNTVQIQHNPLIFG
jgi:hypothetical protein